MINLHDNFWIPSDGYEYITNGEVVTDSIYLGRGANIEDWWDTNDPTPPDINDMAEAFNILVGETS